jgi:hypothetical protein
MTQSPEKKFIVSQKTLVIFIVLVMLTIAGTFIWRVATHGFQ